jgi:biopolymer transport protein ExbD
MFKTTLKKKSTINIIPMIDVIFFLLIFFMLFTTFRSNPMGIDLQLPKAVTVSEQQSKSIIIDITKEGEVYYQGKKISLSNLMEIARKKINENNEIVAIINADREVRYKHLISVMDTVRQVGIYRLALAAEKKE